MALSEVPVLVLVLALSIQAAKRAGSIIREVHRGGKLDVVEKGVDDPQTVADRRSEGSVRLS